MKKIVMLMMVCGMMTLVCWGCALPQRGEGQNTQATESAKGAGQSDANMPESAETQGQETAPNATVEEPAQVDRAKDEFTLEDIEPVSKDGKRIRFGMTSKDLEAMVGKPRMIDEEFNSDSLIYDGYSVNFTDFAEQDNTYKNIIRIGIFSNSDDLEYAETNAADWSILGNIGVGSPITDILDAFSKDELLVMDIVLGNAYYVGFSEVDEKLEIVKNIPENTDVSKLGVEYTIQFFVRNDEEYVDAIAVSKIIVSE